MKKVVFSASAAPNGFSSFGSSPAVSPVPASIPGEGQLRVWWVPQVPMKSFEVAVADLEQASLLLSVLADYDAFQFKNRIKPDYCNAGGLSVFEDGEWVDWWSEDGLDFDEVRRDPELLAAEIAKATRTDPLATLVLEMSGHASALISAFDELRAMTVAERIITGRSDRELRKASEEAIAGLRATLAKLEAL